MDEDLGISGSGSTRGSNVWYAMPYSYRQAIALTLLYSRQLWDSNYSVKTTAMANNPNVSTRIATQFLIYEIVTGLETFIRNGGTAMDPTNKVGKTSAKNLPVGLYLLVETKVPEMVTSTTNPFFVSLPMTTVTGNDNSASQNGGAAWNYDVVVYPKQETGIPTLEKTVRESKADTGKNEGSASITDGFAHTATGSAGDTMEYQIVSTLPTITSQATALSTYNFYDTLCEGLAYDKDAAAAHFRRCGRCTPLPAPD